MQHILASVLKSPLHYLLGKRLTKAFNGTEYHGTVIDTDVDDDSKRIVYGVRYDDGEKEDLFIEELLRHLDEDQPLDAARVQQLHKNVRPDGDQKWIFVPPGTDEMPMETEQHADTATTPTNTRHATAPNADGGPRATTNTTPEGTDSEPFTKTGAANAEMTPTNRQKLGVIHPPDPTESDAITTAIEPEPDATNMPKADASESENPNAQKQHADHLVTITPPQHVSKPPDNAEDTNNGIEMVNQTPNTTAETTADTRTTETTTTLSKPTHQYPLRNRKQPQQHSRPNAAKPVAIGRTMQKRGRNGNTKTNGQQRTPPLHKWKSPRAVMTAVIGSYHRLAPFRTNQNGTKSRDTREPPELADKSGEPTQAPALNEREFGTNTDDTFDFGSYICVVDAPVN
jgi:hypothetical protein